MKIFSLVINIRLVRKANSECC